MLDKICSFLLLPFYGLWQVLLGKNCILSVSEFQIKLLSCKTLALCAVNITIYLDTAWIPLKIFVALTAFLGIFYATISFLLKSSLGFLKKRWERDKYFEYKICIFWSFILLILLGSLGEPTSNRIITLLMFSEVLAIFIFVGFEFPDEPPKKKEVREKSGSWLAKLLAPRPVTNV